MSEVLWNLVKGSFSELVCCKRPAVSGRSVLRLDYCPLNLKSPSPTGRICEEAKKTLLGVKNSVGDGFCREMNAFILRANKKRLFPCAKKRFRCCRHCRKPGGISDGVAVKAICFYGWRYGVIGEKI